MFGIFGRCIVLLLAINSLAICRAFLYAEEPATVPPAVVEKEKAEERGAASPELAFAGFKKAVEKNDWKTAFRFQTDDSRDYMVGGLLAIFHQGALGEEGKKLMSTFADPAKVDQQVAEILKVPPEKQPMLGRQMAKLVEKKAEFLNSSMQLLKQQKKENWVADLEHTKLIDLKINGDRATAEMEQRVGTGLGREPMRFRRIDGAWYVDYNNE